MVTGLSAWRPSCPSGPRTGSPPTRASRTPPAAGCARAAAEDTTVTRSPLAAGLHRTLLLPHSGIMLADPAGVVRYRLATALPTGSFDGPTLQAAIDRP